MEVEPAYEKATEEFLHEELEYVVVQNWNEAERGIELMRTDLDGRATFLVHPEAGEQARASESLAGDEGVIGRLSDHLRFTNGFASAPRDLLPRLAHCFLAKDRAAAQRLATAHPEFFFLLPDGVSYHGHAVSGGKKTGSGPLALKRELRELTGEVQVKQRAVEGDGRRRWSNWSARSPDSARIWRACGPCSRRRRKTRWRWITSIGKLAEEFTRAQSRLSVARLELERLRQEGGRAREQQERDQRLLDERETARSMEEQVLEQSRADFEELQSQAHLLAEEHGALRAELAGFEERQRSERATQARHRGGDCGGGGAARRNRGRDGTPGRGAGAAAFRQHRAGSARRRISGSDSRLPKRLWRIWRRGRPGSARILRLSMKR